MRTTVSLDDDVAAAVARLRTDDMVGVSEAVNRLVRRGLTARGDKPKRFTQRTANLGLTLDVTNVAEALDLLDEPTRP